MLANGLSTLWGRWSSAPRRWSIMLASLLALALVNCTDDTTVPELVVYAMEVTPGEPALAIGDTVRLVSLPKTADGQVLGGIAVAWTVDDTAVATITPLGLHARVRAKKSGVVTVTATASGKSGTSRISVHFPAPATTTLQPASVLEQSAGVIVTVTGSGFVPESRVLWNGAERAATYVNAHTLRIELSAGDVAEAGVTEVRVQNPAPGGGASNALSFTVSSAAVVRVTLDPAAATIVSGQSARLTATPRDAFDRPLSRPVTWSSATPAVATVDANGNVQALSPGVTLVTAQSELVAASAVVTVQPPAQTAPVITDISPDSTGTPMYGHGVDVTITGSGFTPNVVTFVNSTSRYAEVISPTQLKTTFTYDDIKQPRTLRIRIHNPATQLWSNELPFVVYQDLEYLKVTPAQSYWFVGETTTLQAIGHDGFGNTYHHPVSWVSENPSVATVDASGRVTMLKTGQALIRAHMKGRTDAGIINVVNPPAFDLLYESDRSGRPELYLLTPGPNAAPRRVLPAGTFGADPAPSPDGNQIAFVGRDAANNSDIYVVNRDGSNLRRLTNDPAEDDQPVWSPDGNRIAFRSHRSGYRDIWVMGADGSNLRNLTGGGLRVGVPSASRPTWSPDGSRIAFSYVDMSVAPFRPTIVSIDPNGQNARLLIGTGQGDTDPTYSPNGQYLAFRTTLPGSPQLIQVWNADGTGLGWLFQSGHGYTPGWSPDSEWLAFVSSDDESLPTEVFITRLGTPMRKRITLGGAAGGGANPAWIRR